MSKRATLEPTDRKYNKKQKTKNKKKQKTNKQTNKQVNLPNFGDDVGI
jgi:hypothetical protein